jgi:hypothetical protein
MIYYNRYALILIPGHISAFYSPTGYEEETLVHINKGNSFFLVKTICINYRPVIYHFIWLEGLRSVTEQLSHNDFYSNYSKTKNF